MYTALYYPHTTIQNVELLKMGMLLWDRIEYVSPFEGFRHEAQGYDIDAALEILTVPHVPTSDEMQLAHAEIENLLKHELPDWFFMEVPDDGSEYEMYPQKLLPESWQLLKDAELVRKSNSLAPGYDFHDYKTTSCVGLMLMAILAECCAGTQTRTITDYFESYRILSNYRVRIDNSIVDASQPEFAELVKISLAMFDLKDVDIRRLVELRRQEARDGDSVLSYTRRLYVEKVDKFGSKLSDINVKARERMEIVRQFKTEMENDAKALRVELGLNRALLRTKVLVGVCGPLVYLIEPSLGGAASLST
jgi:hypothetical protein